MVGRVVALPCLALPCLSPCVPMVSLWGILGRIAWAFLVYGHFSRFKGLSRAGWCWVSSEPLKCRYGAKNGLYRVVILFACVRCPPARGKKPFLSLSLLGLSVPIFAGLLPSVVLGT